MISIYAHSVLKEQLKRHEGLRLNAYHDLGGILTIGYGRNLDAKGISVGEADFMLSNDIDHINEQLQGLDWFDELTSPRQVVVLNMAFNMGLAGVLGFRQMIDAMERGDFEAAANEMLASRWATQVGKRATELAAMMRGGAFV